MFFARLRVRSSNSIDIPAEGATFSFLNRSVNTCKEDALPNQADTNWFIFRAVEFPTEDEAWEFGLKLSAFLLVFGAKSNLAFDVGNNRSTLQFSEAVRAAMESVQPKSRVSSSAHGLSVHSEDWTWSFVKTHATGTATSSPDSLFDAALHAKLDFCVPDENVLGSLELINAAKLSQSSHAKMVLAFASIERLGQVESMTPTQIDLRGKASKFVTSLLIGSISDRESISSAIQRIKSPISLRSGVVSALEKGNRGDLRRAWDQKGGFKFQVQLLI